MADSDDNLKERIEKEIKVQGNVLRQLKLDKAPKLEVHYCYVNNNLSYSVNAYG